MNAFLLNILWSYGLQNTYAAVSTGTELIKTALLFNTSKAMATACKALFNRNV